MSLNLSDWEQVGVIGVDAGICWLGDPCYILHKDKPYTTIGKNWHDFCDKLEPHVTQFNYEMGHAGLGVVVSTGWGDGLYPVEVRRTSDKRVAEVRIVFINDEEDGEDLDSDTKWEHFDH